MRKMSLENVKAKLAKEALKSRPIPSSQKWRTQAHQNQLVTQISSTLQERHNWPSLLQSLNLSSTTLTPPLLNQILLKTQSNPDLTLSFFNWVKSNLNIQPDLNSHCHLIRILVQSDLHHQAERILTSMQLLKPDVTRVVDNLVKCCGERDCGRKVLTFVVGWYAMEGLCAEALRGFVAVRVYGVLPDVAACNALIDLLVREERVRCVWCVYGAMVRHGVLPDKMTWIAIGRVLGKDRGFERVRRLLNLGVCNSVMFNLVISDLCEKGQLRDAVKVFDEMYERKVQPGFSSYISVLDAACKYKDEETVKVVISLMVNRRLFSNDLTLVHDEVIQKVADLGKSYAAEMLFRQARDEKMKLQDATYGCLLRSLSNDARVEEAISLHDKIEEMGVRVSDNAYFAFANALCKGSPNEVVTKLLLYMIGKGIRPKASELSTFIKLLCSKGRWQEAEQLLEMVMDEKSMPELDCCSSLVKHYCKTKRMDAAMSLHNRIEKLNGNINLCSYNLLLDALFAAGRGNEAAKVFDYIRMRNLLNCDSFVIMIRWLCSAKELRKAMMYHDEMLKLGLKPDQKIYKQLISGFR